MGLIGMIEHSTVAPAAPRVDFVDLSAVAAGALALALTALFLMVAPLLGKKSQRDYTVFWATGQQLAHRANPYDKTRLGEIEREAGLNVRVGTLYMRNPPWMLPLALPLGFLSMKVGTVLWSLVGLSSLLLSGWLMWQMHGSPGNHTHWLIFSFAPSLMCLFMGQTTMLPLLGLLLFERLYRTRPFAAGCALWLCSLKPHLFLPFLAVLVVWIAVSRSYRILAGAVSALAVSCAAAWLIDPAAWSQYSAMMHSPVVQQDYIPCFGLILRQRIDPGATWIQYLPAAAACLWALGYYWRHRAEWDWRTHGNLLALVSVLAAPYSWLYDQTLALPALIDAAYAARQRWLLTVLAAISVGIFGALFSGTNIASNLFVWTGPLWLAWYLVARISSRPVAAEPQTAV